MDERSQGQWVDHEFEQTVREAAYFLWEEGGRQSGLDQEYWFAALDRCLREREADQLLSQGKPDFLHTWDQ